MADVFISYQRSRSADIAYIIRDRLEDEGIDAFMDIKGLSAAGQFPPQLGRAIAEARVFLCLLGPDTLASDWVRKEIDQACNLGLTLIPVFHPEFTEPEDIQDQSVRDLLRSQGVELPASNKYLDPALDQIVQLVKSALPPPPPPPPPPERYWWKIALAGAIGLALGALLMGALGRDGEPSPNPSPTPELAPLPAAWKTNLSDGERVAQIVTFIAEYPGELGGDLWAFVVSPNGRAYPQSEDACQGARIPGRDGKWEMRIGLGGADSAGEIFDIVLAVANTPDDSQFIGYKLMAWCADGEFPGFPVLPEEVTEVYRVRGLLRTEEQWDRPPRLVQAQLDGQVTITSPAEGDRVGAEVEVTGTYAEAEGEIWVLVYPSHGRWYPQSEFPCEASHVLKGNGQWRAPKVTFGDDPERPFDIVVVVADEGASAFFDSRLKLWCKAGYYPGLPTIELPPGIQEKSRIRVYRE